MGFAEQPGDGAHIQGTRDGVPGHLTLPGHAEKGSGGEEALGVRPSTRDLQKGLCHLPIFSRGPPIGAESHRCAPLLQGLRPLTTTCIGGPKCGPRHGVAGTWQAMDSSARMSEPKDRHFVPPERVPPWSRPSRCVPGGLASGWALP